MTIPISRHRLYQLLKDGAGRNIPGDSDFDALGFDVPASARRDAVKASREAIAIYASGEHEGARRHMENAAERIIGALPEELQNLGAERPDPLADVDDPRELAARVSRW